MNNISLLKQREEEIKQALLTSVDTLSSTRKAFKEASRSFEELCSEKLRVQTALFELEGKVTHVRPKVSKEQTTRKLSVKKEWDEVQALLQSHGLSRKEIS